MDKVRKEIQERAINALDAWDIDVFYHCSELTKDSFKDGYEQGAIEQEPISYLRGRNDALKEMTEVMEKNKQKMINKAWIWIENYRHMDAHWTMEQMKEHFIKTVMENRYD